MYPVSGLAREGRKRPILLLAAGLLLQGSFAAARSVHSYVNEQGVLTYFSVPEKHVDIDGVATAIPERTAPEAAGRAPGPLSRYDSSIIKYATAYSVDPDLVRAVIATESDFNPIAVSRRGAVGLMQLIPSTARRFGVRDIFHPDQNIEGGVKYLRFLLDMFDNDLRLALAAYNAGENVVKRVRGVPNYPETVAYVRKITARYGDTYRFQSVDASPASILPNDAAMRVYRVVDPLGNVIYTNRPILP